MKVAIVHFHLRRGGVTRVIESATESLADRAEFVILSGEAVPDSGVSLSNVRVIPELAYREIGTSADADALAERLRDEARDAFGGEGPDLWHFHNHSLGKNVRAPAAIGRLAGEGERFLLQIHDFAEDGRPGNYRRQRAFDPEGEIYPAAPQIHYAVLNSRDLAFLNRAGAESGRLHLLANPVGGLPADPDPGPRPFAKDRQFLLYPTRGIRRKNVGELLLLAALSGDRFEFATTLAPENPEWQPVHDRWARVAADHQLAVHLGLGETDEHRFEQLIAWSDALITTSVAEGFGLAFLEPWLAGKAVTGRNLPEITEDFAAAGISLEHLYPALNIPPDWIDTGDFRKKLAEKLGASFRSYGRELPAEAVEEAWHGAVSNEGVDFGRLNEELQEQAIERAMKEKSEPVSLPLVWGNEELIAENSRCVREVYSFEKYGDRLFAIYQSIIDANPGPIETLDSEALLDAFLEPKRFCLLRS